uniref:Uncharacterized protein n=1 Tax=viral metagenome TaxID=1070528 RepID=A0A6C0C4B3_9ZZZZ
MSEFAKAVKSGNIGKVKQLLFKEDADPNIKDILFNGRNKKKGNTALIFAAQEGHKEIVELLIKAGADPDMTDIYGTTALMASCKFNAVNDNYNLDIIKLLLKGDVNINLQNEMDETALMIASEHGNTGIVEILITAGANLDIQGGSNGDSALIMASDGLPEIVKLLLDAGANINLENAYGDTALTMATESRNLDCIILLIDAAEREGLNPLDDPQLQEIYADYILSKVKKLQAKQRLKFATMIIDENQIGEPSYDVIIKILKSLKIPVLNKDTLDKTNDLLMRTLQQELQKEIEKSLKREFKGEKLDNMIEFYRKQLRDPGLPKNIRKAYKRQKRRRKQKMSISLGSSDVSSLSEGLGMKRKKSQKKSKSKGSSKKKNNKKMKSKKRKKQ